MAEQLETIEKKTPTPDQLYFLSIDDYPDLRSRRVSLLAESQNILFNNRDMLERGSTEEQISLPLPIDVLSVSNKIVEAEEQHLDHSAADQALLEDCIRLVSEARRKNKPEYFSPILEEYDEENDDLIRNGVSLNKTLVNGLSPYCAMEEQEIRQLEYVEHHTFRELAKLIRKTGGRLALATIKECPKYAFDKPESSLGGYVANINKFVIQIDTITPEGVYHEQVLIAGTLIDREVIRDYLKEKGVLQPNDDPSILEIRSKQMIVAANPDTLLNIVSELDKKASQVHQIPVFMGEEVPEDYSKDY